MRLSEIRESCRGMADAELFWQKLPIRGNQGQRDHRQLRGFCRRHARAFKEGWPRLRPQQKRSVPIRDRKRQLVNGVALHALLNLLDKGGVSTALSGSSC